MRNRQNTMQHRQNTVLDFPTGICCNPPCSLGGRVVRRNDSGDKAQTEMSVLIRLFVWERSDPMELKFLPSLLGAESLWLAMPIAEVLTALYAAYTMSRYTRRYR